MKQVIKPLRILHMIGSLEMGGSQSFVMNLYRNIDRNKIQFDFIIDNSQDTYFASEIKALGGRIFVMPKFNGVNMLKVKKMWTDFFLKHKEYSILHSHVRSYASIYIPIAKKYGLKTIVHSHSTSNGFGIASLIKIILQFPLRYQADYLMACSNEAGEWLYGKNACKKKNYFFIPNAIDIKRYEFNKSVRDEYRKLLNIEDKLVIGHIGRFHEAKNHLFLLDVFAKIHNKFPNSVLLLIGDGNLRESIEERINTLGLLECVILLGNRNDVPQLLQAMDVYIFPSLWEGLPIAVVEAQAAGLPCFISDKITKDVDISELVIRLPLDNINIWVDRILNFELKRLNVISKIKKAGFDVQSITLRLTEFYYNLKNV